MSTNHEPAATKDDDAAAALGVGHPLAAAQSESESSHEKRKLGSVSSGDDEVQRQKDEAQGRPLEATAAHEQGADSQAGRGNEDEDEDEDGLAKKKKRRMSRAGSVPDFLKPTPRVKGASQKLWSFLANNLNFYRIHLTVFTLTPLVFSAIFWASNTTEIKYIDCLFVCVSAMTVTGLTPINLSISTPWQQAILFFLMCIGNISAVSITMVLIRRHFFRLKFDDVIRKSARARKRMQDVEVAHQKEKRKELIRLQRLVGLRKRHRRHRHGHHDGDDDGDDIDGDDSPSSTPRRGEGGAAVGGEGSPRSSASTDSIASAELRAERKKKATKHKKGPLRADMIKRMDQPAVLINPMGMPSTAVREPTPEQPPPEQSALTRSPSAPFAASTGGGGGGILASSAGGPDESSGDDQQPNVRIALPDESQRRRSNVTVESPQELSLDSNLLSPPNANATATSAGSGTGSGSGAGSGSGSSSGGGGSKRRRGSIPPFRLAADGGEPMPRTVEPHRTRFSDAADDDDRPARRTSDPTRGGQLAHHARHGSDVGAIRPLVTRPAPDFPRAQTVEFSEPYVDRERRSVNHDRSAATTTAFSPGAAQSLGPGSASLRNRVPTLDFERTPTMRSSTGGQGGYGYGGYGRRNTGVPMTRTQTTSKERGFGGFPTPFEIAGFALKKALPQLEERFSRSTTMPRTATFASTYSATGANVDPNTRSAPYLSFDATVSRNSRFHELTETQRDELGGVEYRAIDLLAKLLPAYWLGINFLMVVLVAPWLASASAVTVHRVFAGQGATAPDTTWFWFFQVISAYSNTGFSLIDTSMIQMADQYFMLIPIGLLILAGNTAFPIFLRFFIWLCSLCVPKSSRVYETLRFLLDHPRRCFVYLFPSAQTWFLLLVLVVLNSTDWVFFQVLDIGNPVIEAWSVGQRTFDGLFQSIAVRAAGFQIISLLALAPAVQFLYIVMMYISAYPIAMSVRNTNVYEERSLGIYNDSDETPPAYDDGALNTGGAKVWGTYLAAHARRQLAFDIWWLGFALWLICIIEKTNIEDPASNGWFTVFSCLFELTSAYGTVGLSTGTPYDNFSLSGRFSTLSKLVVIAVMLRGRHRGLPVAIDRAILLPSDLEYEDDLNQADLVLDESGNLRSRNTFAPTASNSFFPRSATGATNPATTFTPRTVRARSESLERVPSRPVLGDGGGGGSEQQQQQQFDDDDGRDFKDLSYIVENTTQEEAQQDDAAADAGDGHISSRLQRPSLGQHYHLSAIREATPSPLTATTPTAMSRANSGNAQSQQQQQQQQAADASSNGSSDSNKGKARETGTASDSPPPPFEKATRIESLQSDVVDDSSTHEHGSIADEQHAARREEEYRRKYSCD